MTDTSLEWLCGHLLALEKEMLLPKVRGSAQRLGEILSPEFIEFGSSGTVYCYRQGDTFGSFPPHIHVEIVDFHIKALCGSCVLATYVCIKTNMSDGLKSRSLRSSVWQQIQGVWKVVFHQGTPCP